MTPCSPETGGARPLPFYFRRVKTGKRIITSVESGIMRLFHIIPLIIMATLALIAVDDVDAAVEPPQDEHLQGYDIVITEGRNGSIILTYKDVSEDGDDVWKRVDYPSGSDVVVCRWSDNRGDISVAMDGPDIGALTIVRFDDIDTKSYDYVNVNFTMFSGSIRNFTALTVDGSQSSKLGNVYDGMVNPINELSMDIRGGYIRLLNPTSDMIHVTDMHVIIRSGATIDRLYTSGENGKYTSIWIDLLGGNIGYMTNLKSRVGTLDINMDHGVVEYLAIGADTENSNNRVLDSLNTFIVTADTNVFISETVVYREIVLGGGLIDIPSLQWNTESSPEIRMKNIVIEATGVYVDNSTCFLNEKRSSAYHFNNYRFGSSPTTSPLSSSFSHEGQTIDVYGPEGIWETPGSFDIDVGLSLYVSCVLEIPAEGYIHVNHGGKFVNTGIIDLDGTINIMGELINGGTVRKIGSGNVVGIVSGHGHIADLITIQSNTGQVSVMSPDDTVIIQQDNPSPLESLSVVLDNGRRSLTIAAHEGKTIHSEEYLVKIVEYGSMEQFTNIFSLYIRGIEALVTDCDIIMTVPAMVPTGYVAQVFAYDQSDDTFERVSIVDVTPYALSFECHENLDYCLMIAPMVEDGQVNGDGSITISVILVMIIAVLLVTMYALLRKK